MAQWEKIFRRTYYLIAPQKVRKLIYKWRHPEYRLEDELSRRSRCAIQAFMDGLAREGVLSGSILEIGAGGREDNRQRFAARAQNYWRSDILQWPKSSLDLYCDCTRMPLKEASLDAIICSEVLEHVPEAANAVAGMTSALRPHGYLVLTVPFFYPLHGVDKKEYGDFWRFTPATLKLLLQNDFDLVKLNTTHLFRAGDPFVIGVQMLWRRKGPAAEPG